MYNEMDTDTLQQQLKNLLRESESAYFYETWADTFEILKIDEKSVVIGYFGTEPLKKFKKECETILLTDICVVAGYKDKIKIVKVADKGAAAEKIEPKQNQPKPINSKTKNTTVKKNIKTVKLLAVSMVCIFIALSIGVVLWNYIENRSFKETFYNVGSLKVNNNVRVISITDLHNCSYGKDNQKLITRIEKLNPDLIICTGDMVDSDSTDIKRVEILGKALSKVAPLYYIYGNNEVLSSYGFALGKIEIDQKLGFSDENRDANKLLELEDSLQGKLESAGFKVLKNGKDTIEVGTTKIDVYGVLTSNPSAFWDYAGGSFNDYLYEEADHLKITAIHEPFIFEEFNPDSWGDLMLCGHTHGGEIQVPVLGPVYTREGGLFPERQGHFVYGRCDVAGRPLIVSSGLDNRNLFRINNQPEMVIVDINKF